MELHTVGVNGGYTQSDVTNLSAILTGWTVNQPYQAGAFQFDPKRHEPGAKVWLGNKIGSGQTFVPQGGSAINAELAARSTPSMNDSMDEMMAGGATEQKAATLANAPGNAGMKEGLEALNLLAHSPQTAHFISWKIAQRFVADDPLPALCGRRMARTFLSIRWRHQGGVADARGESGVQLEEVFSQQSEDADGVSRVGLPDNADRSFESRRAGEHHPDHGNAAVLRASTDRVLHHRGSLDEFERAGRDRLELRVSTGPQREVCANQKFDAPKVVALGLMSEPSQPQIAGVAPTRASAAKYSDATWTAAYGCGVYGDSFRHGDCAEGVGVDVDRRRRVEPDQRIDP